MAVPSQYFVTSAVKKTGKTSPSFINETNEELKQSFPRADKGAGYAGQFTTLLAQLLLARLPAYFECEAHPGYNPWLPATLHCF